MNEKVVVGLDKLVVGLTYTKMPKGEESAKLSVVEKQNIQEQLKEFKARMMHIKNMIKHGKHFAKHTGQEGVRRYCVQSEEAGTPLFYVHLGCAYGTWVIKFEFNSAKLSLAERDEFLANLEGMLDGHYAELYTQGVISHAEFCVDVYGADISSLMLVSSRNKSYRRFETTTYIGPRGSSDVLTMYDKAKQLGASDKRVRFEARLKERYITLQQLVEYSHLLPNPFGNAIVVDVSRVQAVADELGNPSLANHLNELGLSGGVKNKYAKAQIFSRLQQEAVDWWKPEQFWSEHQALLKGLHPKVFN